MTRHPLHPAPLPVSLLILLGIFLLGITLSANAAEVIRPGDELLIDFPGQPELSGVYGVDVRGFLIVEPADPCRVTNLATDSAADTLAGVLADYYRESSGLSIRVLRRRLAVRVEGRVHASGDYFLPHFATVEDALLAAGGIREGGLLTRVRIFRDGDFMELDLREFRVSGDPSRLPALRTGDRIYVPVSNRNAPVEASLAPLELAIDDPNIIHVIGAVRNAGTHRIHGRVSLLEALALGGGPDETADLKRVQIVPAAGDPYLADVKGFAAGSGGSLPEIAAGDTILVPVRERHMFFKVLQITRDLIPVVLLGLALGGE
ncbi:MAG: hypothetical protein GY835_08100 [bacterium]|nr:hypothetical protein [bacterium]